MKYILLPIFKFIWAILFSIYIIFPYTIIIIYYILFIIWNFRLPKEYDEIDWRYSLDRRKGYFYQTNYSSYSTVVDNNKYYFKTAFHFIWNIGKPKIEK